MFFPRALIRSDSVAHVVELHQFTAGFTGSNVRIRNAVNNRRFRNMASMSRDLLVGIRVPEGLHCGLGYAGVCVAETFWHIQAQ